MTGSPPPKRSFYIDEGVRLFNEGDYFLAHETLEEYWIEAPAGERNLLQGLIHLAVGMLHYSKGNLTGARLQFKKAGNRLAGYPDVAAGVDVARVREFLTLTGPFLDEGKALTAPTL